MTFDEALKAMREGKKVRLSDWSDSMMIQEKLVWYDEAEKTVHLSNCFIFRKDWEIVE